MRTHILIHMDSLPKCRTSVFSDVEGRLELRVGGLTESSRTRPVNARIPTGFKWTSQAQVGRQVSEFTSFPYRALS